jgi:outer membrane immunogenic protein
MGMMFRIITTALLLSAGSALAADPAPPDLRAPAYNWTGFYAGASGALVLGTSRQTYGGDRAGLPDAFLPVGFDVTGNYGVTGVLIGGQVGFNYQMGSIVMGVELDGALGGAAGRAGPTAGAILAGANAARGFHTEQNWLSTGRLRLGYAADKWLLYVTGGLALSGFSVNNEAVAVAPTTANRVPTKVNRLGWVAGIGAEYALGGNWSAKGEVLYADFGRFFYSDSPAANGCVQCYSMNVRTSEWVVRVGVNYRFGGAFVQ